MKGGLGKGVCLLAFLISVSHANDSSESQGLRAAIKPASQEEESKSADVIEKSGSQDEESKSADIEKSSYINPGSQEEDSKSAEFAEKTGYFTPESGSEEEESRSGFFIGHSSYVNQGGLSRVIPQHEYIFPHKIPGAEYKITCSREGELHNFQSPSYECLVCVCIREYQNLMPVCASCARCMTKGPEPEPIVIPVTPPHSITTVPPQYETQVSCSPLPRGQPFQNPLHPCQVCTCTESISPFGKPDVLIECQETPQCVVPLEVTTLPPIPELPVPIQLPICEEFPQNVLFPHPTDACKVCKCSVQVLASGIPEQYITCYTKLDCREYAQQPVVIQELTTISPDYYIHEHHVIDGPPVIENDEVVIKYPEIVTADTVVWPPASTPRPTPGQGPLPGPSPHESCRPYIPDQQFQHPWDECQVCVCTEAVAVGLITIEVNCYTKQSCCLRETPALAETFAISGGEVITTTQSPSVLNGGKVQIIDAICEFKSFGVEFIHPQDFCKLCTCDLQGNLITASCKRSPNSECNFPFYPGTVNEDTGSVVTNSLLPTFTGETLHASSMNQPPVEANVVTQGSSSYQNNYGTVPGLTGVRPGNSFIYGGHQGWTYPGHVQGSQLTESETLVIPGYNNEQSNYYKGYNLNYPGITPSEAEILSISGYTNNQPNYVAGSNYFYPGYGLTHLSENGIQYRPRLPNRIENFGLPTELINANQIQSGQYGNKYPRVEDHLETNAETVASGQSGLLQNSNSYAYFGGNNNQNRIPASSLYPSFYNKMPNYEIPLIQSTKYSFENEPQGLPSSQGFSSSSSHSQASASVSVGRIRTKSANPEDNDSEEIAQS